MVLGKVKSGAACPTFKVVCGTAGRCAAGLGLGVGVCAAAIEEAANENADPVASKNKTERAFLIILSGSYTSNEPDHLTLIAGSLHRVRSSDNPQRSVGGARLVCC